MFTIFLSFILDPGLLFTIILLSLNFGNMYFSLVSISQTYRPLTPRRTSGWIVNKTFYAKAMLTEISVNDMIGLKNKSPWHTTKELQKCLHRCHLLLLYFISVIYLGRYWNYTVYSEMPKTFFIAIKTRGPQALTVTWV